MWVARFVSSRFFTSLLNIFFFYRFSSLFSLSPSYSSTTLAVAVTLPGSSETASSSARPLASASGLPPHPAGQLESAAAALSNSVKAPPPLSSSLLELPLRLKAGSLFPPRKTRCPPVAMDAGGPQWPSTTREERELLEKRAPSPSFPSEFLRKHFGGVTSKTTDGPTHTTPCGGFDSTAQRPPSATSSNDGAEQTGSRREEEEESRPLFSAVVPAAPPGKNVAAEQTGLALAVAEALADELAPPEVVEAEAAAVEATAALSCARASELGDDKRGEGFAPAGRKGVPLPPAPPLSKGWSQSSRLVATSVFYFVSGVERDAERKREKWEEA